MSAVQASRTHNAGVATLNDVIRAANSIILGKEDVIRLALACMLARGHLLIEVPRISAGNISLVN